MYPHNYIPIYPHISILYQDNEGAHPYIYIYIYIYIQWWAQLTKKLASVTANPLTEKLASITLNR